MSKIIKVDINNMMTEFVGDKQGISKADIDALAKETKNAFDVIQQGRGTGWTGWMDLPYKQDAIVDEIIAHAETIRAKAKSFVVLGIGGSALGPMAVFQALCHLRHNELSDEKRNAPKFYCEDNVDPERMAALLDVIDVKETYFNVITKSGATSETMTQYLIIIDLLKKALGDDFASHVIATTDKEKGNLIKLAKSEGYKTFFIQDGVGGRFSELCPVGLYPAAVLGIDIKALLAGARAMDEVCAREDIYKNPALITAAMQYISIGRGKNISVMMPYADSLKLVSDWYAQLWAESLGKNMDKQGNPVNVGQTPVKAVGVTDQHSQVQLYAEGPFDKVVTFIGVDKYRTEFVISDGCEDIPDVGFLSGHTMNELISAEMVATEYALTIANRPSYRIMLPEVNAHTLGQLLYFFEMQTAYIGELLNIDTYNQPGVEGGKNATYALLGKSGYEAKAQEINNAPQKKDEFIIC
ncbi:MAG: glucose-6-phosphate isomerase [Bacillota bacterium]